MPGPVLQVPTKTRPTPEVLDSLIWEIVFTDAADYRQIPEGSYHENTRDYSGFRLIKEEQIDQRTSRRWWSNGFTNQNTYNYSGEWFGEAVNYPTYIRRYKVRRDQLAAVAVDTEMGGVWQIRVTAGGTGYAAETTTVSITGGSGSGATAQAIVMDGVVVWIKIVTEGSSYSSAFSSAPTVTITDTGSGTGATATAVIQDSTKSLASVTVTNAGSGYTSAPSVTFSVSGGSGATATAVLSGSTVGSIVVTNAGSGYTSAPTVTIAGGGGLGATATSSLTTSTPLLVSQKFEEFPESDQRHSLYVMMVRVFKTLPGPTMRVREWAAGGLQKVRETTDILPTTTLLGGDNLLAEQLVEVSKAESQRIRETLLNSSGNPVAAGAAEWTLAERDGQWEVTVYHTFRIVPATYVLPNEGSSFSITYPISASGRVIEAQLSKIEGSPNLLAHIEWCDRPDARVDYVDMHYTFPGVFTKLNDWWNNETSGLGFLRRPFIGIDVEHVQPRSLAVTGRRIYQFTFGSDALIPTPYRVISPGIASKVYDIQGNTVHPDLDTYVQNTDAAGNVTEEIIERIQASSPSSYDPYSVLIASSNVHKWRGRWHVREILQVSELRNPQTFPALYVSTPFTATNQVELVKWLDETEEGLGYEGGTGLLAYAAGAATQTMRIQGKRVSVIGLTEETLQLAGTTRVSTSALDWKKMTQVKLSSAAGVTIYLRAPGTPNSGSVTFEDALATGETLAITRDDGSGPVSRTFTFTSPEKTAVVCGNYNSIGVKATGTLTATANFANGETVLIDGRTYTFQTVLTDSNGNVLIGANASASLDNLIASINRAAGAGTTYATSTSENTSVTAAAGAGDTMDVTAISGGSAGNSITTTETCANASWGSATLTGGAYGRFSIYDANGQVHVWFKKTASDTDPVYPAGQRAIEVDVSDLPDTSDDPTTAESMADYLATALLADGAFIADVSGDDVTIWDAFLGLRTDASIESSSLVSPWAISVSTQGIAVAANQIRMTTPRGTASALKAALTDMATAIIDGQAATGTTALAFEDDIEATIRQEVISGVATSYPTVLIEDKFDVVPTTTWTLTGNTNVTVVNVANGSEGPIVAQFDAGQTDAYGDIDLWNPDLLEDNVPAGLSGTSDAVAIDGQPWYILARADGKPAILLSYQTSADNVTWSGSVSLPKVGNRGYYKTAGTAPYPNYIRLLFDASTSTVARSLHAAVYVDITS